MDPRDGGHDADGPDDAERLSADPSDDTSLARELARAEVRRVRTVGLAAFAGVGTAVIAAATLTLDGINLPWWVGLVLLATTATFFLDVLLQERAMRRLTAAAIEAGDRGRTLEATVADLTALSEVARRVNGVLLPEEVYEVVLDAAVELLDGTSGSIRLRVRDRLAVAAAMGEGEPQPGSARLLEEDPDVVVVTLGSTVREASPPRLAVPVTVGRRHVGVLEVARAAGDAPFSDRQMLLAQLFAEKAATAFVNANHYDQERERADRAIAVSELRADAIADTVHDLRAPLAGVYGFAQLLELRLDRMTPEKRDEIVASLSAEAARLSSMVDEVFEVATVDARTTPRVPVDLGAVAASVVETVRVAHGSGTTIELDAAPDAIVLGDEETLRRITANLVANAAEHGGGEVLVRVQRRGAEVRLHVADRGDGIPAAQLEHLFRRRMTGSVRGRGLAIVDGLVRALGGRVGVRSREGVGTVFTVRLPAA